MVLTTTILVVEDERLLREMIAEGLRRRGYEVLLAGDGHEAARICSERHKHIHLMLCDVMMPGLRPRELIRIVLEIFPSMIVLLMTGYPEENLYPNGNSEGFHFIQKPFTPSELARRLEAILGNMRHDKARFPYSRVASNRVMGSINTGSVRRRN